MRARLALVLGLGRFGGGAATARFLVGRGYRVRIADRAAASTLQAAVTSLADLARIEFRLGCADDDTSLLCGVDLLVCNPAVPDDHPVLALARGRGIRITQEVNLFLESYPGRVVAVTGTNGKSSTATLLAAVLRRLKTDTLLGGNIGHSLLIDVERWRPEQVAVLELSSFQLERVDPARHRIAGTVFTRITEDHLDRHGSLLAYRSAKARAAAMADEFVAFPSDDPVAASIRHDAGAALPYGRAADGFGSREQCDGWVVWDRDAERTVLCESACSMPGRFQLQNAAAACTAAAHLSRTGTATDRDKQRHAMGVAIALTQPLPYRLQLRAAIDGVRIFDNSVSTHVESTVSALTSLPGRIHWVGGGKSKDGRFAEPAERLREHVETAHLFGTAAPRLGPLLRERVTTTVHDDLEDALDAAWRECRAGDAILFSPGFASFDQFPNFAARAERFGEWVRHLQASGATQAR